MEQAFRERTNERLAIVAVNLGEPPGPVATFAKELGLTFTLALDRDRKVTERYEIFGLPSSFFVDRDGAVRSIKAGPFLSKAEIDNGIQGLL